MIAAADSADAASRFALDVQGLGELRLKARTDPEAALQGAARQFEAILMQMMLKSMRDAVGQEDSLFDSEQTRQFTSMLDQQLAQTLSDKGIGLSDILVRQLRQTMPVAQASSGAAPTPAPAAFVTEPRPAGEAAPDMGYAPAASRSADFVNRLWPHAAAASRATGIAPHFMIGHAALESGWGRAEIRGPDGSPSHNLFGIKAGRGWNGPVVETTTTEYVNGVAQKSVEKFRAYGSYEEAFQDYARLLRGNPRYAAVIEGGKDAAAFATGLQQAGYATDPMYADKLSRILQSSALRQGLVG